MYGSKAKLVDFPVWSMRANVFSMFSYSISVIWNGCLRNTEMTDEIPFGIVSEALALTHLDA